MFPEYNDLFFYGGLVLSAFSVFMLIISILLGRLKKARLDAELDEEYGREKGKKRDGD